MRKKRLPSSSMKHGGGRLGVVPVALEDLRAVRDDLAHLARPAARASVSGSTTRASVSKIGMPRHCFFGAVGRIDVRRRDRLGQPVALDVVDAGRAP